MTFTQIAIGLVAYAAFVGLIVRLFAVCAQADARSDTEQRHRETQAGFQHHGERNRSNRSNDHA